VTAPTFRSCLPSTNTNLEDRALPWGARLESTMNVAVRTTTAPVDAGALKLQAARLRGKIIEMSHAAQAAHLASSLSCADVLTAAYWNVLNVDPKKPTDPLRDRFILSK